MLAIETMGPAKRLNVDDGPVITEIEYVFTMES